MKKKILISIVLSSTFLWAGFALLYYDMVGYGISFFVFLPFLLGYILGKSTIKNISLAGLIFSVFTFFSLLITGKLEGMVCILMAMPLIFVSIALGYLVKLLISRFVPNEDDDLLDSNHFKSSILPFLAFAVMGVAEKKLTENSTAVIRVESEIILPFSALEVYETIKSVDTLDAEKPFLMQLDLPVPMKCILEEEKVGGLRTCYFEGGQIVERVTALEKGKLLQMDVISYELTGREWLGFEEAIYTFETLTDGRCKMVRITTYTSVLYPRWYWQPLEKIGIEQEHDYVFSNLKKDLNRKYN